jgi:hypothetical protein
VSVGLGIDWHPREDIYERRDGHLVYIQDILKVVISANVMRIPQDEHCLVKASTSLLRMSVHSL